MERDTERSANGLHASQLRLYTAESAVGAQLGRDGGFRDAAEAEEYALNAADRLGLVGQLPGGGSEYGPFLEVRFGDRRHHSSVTHVAEGAAVSAVITLGEGMRDRLTILHELAHLAEDYAERAAAGQPLYSSANAGEEAREHSAVFEQTFLQFLDREMPEHGAALRAELGGPVPTDPAEMSYKQFAADPRTLWHGTVWGELTDIPGPTGIHVGSYEAARTALAARSGFDFGPREPEAERPALALAEAATWFGEPDGDGISRKQSFAFGEIRVKLSVADGVLTATALESDQDRGRSWTADVLRGIANRYWLGLEVDGERRLEPGPRDWTQSGLLNGGRGSKDPSQRPALFPVWVVGELSEGVRSDEQANGIMGSLLKRGVARRGMRYTNISEDEGSVSVVVPDRSFLKTWDDFQAISQPGLASLEAAAELGDSMRPTMFDPSAVEVAAAPPPPDTDPEIG